MPINGSWKLLQVALEADLFHDRAQLAVDALHLRQAERVDLWPMGIATDEAVVGGDAVGPFRRVDVDARRRTVLDAYGATNEAEFFAVATETYFEKPRRLARKHPELYAMLSRVFSQDLRERAAALARERERGQQRFGRNSPCPCGSGKKYKKCCGA